MSELIDRVKCFLNRHRGKKVGTGKVIVTAKRNKFQEPIPGVWDVFKCQRPNCKEKYAEPVK